MLKNTKNFTVKDVHIIQLKTKLLITNYVQLEILLKKVLLVH